MNQFTIRQTLAKAGFFISVLLISGTIVSKTKDILVINKYARSFEKAYLLHPDIPRGVLEAVAFTNTHFAHLTNETEESCTLIPRSYGVMGLVLDGKNYFHSNLLFVSDLSGIGVEEIISTPEKNILAYASAYNILLQSKKIKNTGDIHLRTSIVNLLSELPFDTLNFSKQFPINSFYYSVLTFMNNKTYAKAYYFPEYNIDLKQVFGEENYKVLSSTRIIIDKNSVKDNNGNTFKNGGESVFRLSPDYPSALWNPAASCNYSIGRTQAVSAVTIHTVQGSYAGCISWFQNCAASVSAHYVIRSSDGQITQMVLESNTGWHVGSENPYTIGIEHEGYVNDASWYTTAMYTESGTLVCDITNSGYGINAADCWNGPSCGGGSSQCQLSAAWTTKGHQHYPNQSHTDPGLNWDWGFYSNVVNNCGNVQPPANPTVQQASCPGIGVWLNWQNSGNGWFIDVTDDPSWNIFWNYDVSGLTTVVCPGGFELYPSQGQYLQFQPNTTYYWRIWDGSSHTYGQQFTTPVCIYSDNNCSGTFVDFGGPSSSYNNNEDWTLTISPTNSLNINMNFTSFDLEDQYDFLYIHDGNSIAAPQIPGSPFTGTAGPGNFTSSGPDLTFHFVSDPGVQNAGWEATWSCTQVITGMDKNNMAPFIISVAPNPFFTNAEINYRLNENTMVEFTITDILGRKVFSQTKAETIGAHVFSIGEKEIATKGIFMLMIKAGNSFEMVKLIKQ